MKRIIKILNASDDKKMRLGDLCRESAMAQQTILQFCVLDEPARNFFDVEDVVKNVNNVQVKKSKKRKLVQVSDFCFQNCTNSSYILYKPPYGIVDKQSLLRELDNATIKGLRRSNLQYCYEFIFSDMNELKHQDNVFVVNFGKTNDELYFNVSGSTPLLTELWSQYFNKFANIDSPLFCR